MTEHRVIPAIVERRVERAGICAFADPFDVVLRQLSPAYIEALWNKLRHRFMLPQDVRVDVGPAAAHDFASEVKALDRRLGDRPFALGDRFSAVDILLGDMGGWARAGKFRIESDRVNAYFDRVLARPARARS